MSYPRVEGAPQSERSTSIQGRSGGFDQSTRSGRNSSQDKASQPNASQPRSMSVFCEDIGSDPESQGWWCDMAIGDWDSGIEHESRFSPKAEEKPRPEDYDSSGDETCATAEPFAYHHNLMSQGSKFHDNGNCRPCLHVSSRAGCWAGADCGFCHMPHQKPKRSRPCQRTRQRCRQLVAVLDLLNTNSTDPTELERLEKRLASQCGYMKRVLRGRDAHQRRAANACSYGQGSAGSGASSSHQHDGAGPGSGSVNVAP